MDDQRLQKQWETRKDWLEEATRTKEARDAIEIFSRQTQLVRRRGSVSKCCFFENMEVHRTHDRKHANAALDLAGSIGRRITEVLQGIPFSSLAHDPPVSVPALAFLTEHNDCEPLYYEGKLASGEALPDWLRVQSDTGALKKGASSPPLLEDFKFTIEISMFEGPKAKVTCIITPEVRSISGHPPWFIATGNIFARFNDSQTCPLAEGVRGVLAERLADLYDFKKGAPKPVTLGQWLRSARVLLRMLRSSAVAIVTRTSATANRYGT